MKYFLPILVLLCLITSCKNEDLDDNIERLNFEELIPQTSTLFSLMTQVVTEEGTNGSVICIDFIYSFRLRVYDEAGTLVSENVVTNDGGLFQALNRVEEDQYIGLSFPIQTVLNDGTVFEINDKDELQDAVQECIMGMQIEAINTGTTQLIDCVWVVTPGEDQPAGPYDNAVFDVDGVGTIAFFHRGVEYDGSWIMYFIEDELHLNINFNNEEEIGPDWNFDWKLNIPDTETMELSLEDQLIILKKACDDAEYCTLLEFTSCADEATPDEAEFMLEDYVGCIDIIAAPRDETIDFEFSFYTTISDAELAANAIDTSVPFTNVSNPETLFVRIEDPMTAVFEVTPITLIAEVCED